MRLAWLTDLHLNFVTAPRRHLLYQSIRAAQPDALLVTGDWAEAPSLHAVLNEWQTRLNLPTYYVLGNHDFYQGDITTVRNNLPTLPDLHYLTHAPVIPITPTTALIGHDSWADGRLGHFFESPVMLNDYRLIADLTRLSQRTLFAKLNELGDQAASALERQLEQALTTHPEVLLLTHVPPYKQACWHEGQISTDDFLPHFACQAVGERLTGIMRDHPTRKLTVLCGHTHSSGVAQILPNLTVHTGAAVYGEPAIHQIVTVP